MPISLITGLPGNGKTAYYVNQLLKMEKEKSDRKIYVSGINWLKPPSLNITNVEPYEIESWQNFDDGSLVVVDEAQNIFPQRSSNAKAPEFISKLSEHRHKGLDFILITQDPRLLDAWARRLVQDHRHIKRLFGTSFQAVFIWDKVSDNPADKWERKSALKQLSRIPSRVYGMYKSAAVHTVKKKVPFLFILALIVMVVIPVASYFVIKNFSVGDNLTEQQLPSENANELSIKSTNPNLPVTVTTPKFKIVDFIDNELIFLDAIVYGKYVVINIALVTDYGETLLTLDDIKNETGLKYSLISQNKLILKQGDKKKTLYRTVRHERQTNFGTLVRDANKNPDNQLLKLPF